MFAEPWLVNTAIMEVFTRSQIDVKEDKYFKTFRELLETSNNEILTNSLTFYINIYLILFTFILFEAQQIVLTQAKVPQSLVRSDTTQTQY